MASEQRFVIEKLESGDIRGGRAIKQAVDGLNTGRWVVSISKYKKSRSSAQNGYYHGVVVNAVRDGLIDMGFAKYSLSNETVHEMLKQKFLKEDMANEDGVYISITKSTTELSTTDFMNYIDEIQRWANEFLNIVIQNPGEQSEINY